MHLIIPSPLVPLQSSAVVGQSGEALIVQLAAGVQAVPHPIMGTVILALGGHPAVAAVLEGQPRVEQAMLVAEDKGNESGERICVEGKSTLQSFLNKYVYYRHTNRLSKYCKKDQLFQTTVTVASTNEEIPRRIMKVEMYSPCHVFLRLIIVRF